MARTVTINWDTKTDTLPGAFVQAGFHIFVGNTSYHEYHTAPVSPAVFEFAGPAGTYDVKVWVLDSTGNAQGEPLVGQMVVEERTPVLVPINLVVAVA